MTLLRTRTIRLLALLAALTLLAAACSTGDDESSESEDSEEVSAEEEATEEPTEEPTEEADASADGEEESAEGSDEPEATEEPTEEVVLTDSFRGVTAEAISLGVAFWDTSVFGFGFFGDPDLVWTSLTEAQNAAGGVNGRNLTYSVAGFNPADNEGMLATCIQLTEDDQVFAVLGGLRGDANACVHEQHETILLGSQVVVGDEVLERALAPVAGFAPESEEYALAFIDTLDGQGWFDGATVGVHFDQPNIYEQLEDPVLAALADIGVTDPEVFFFDDLAVDDDTAESQIEIQQEQARSAGVTNMLILGPAATGLITYGPLDIELAAVDSTNFPTAINQGIDPVDLDGTIASAFRIDTADDSVDEQTQACIDAFTSANPDIRTEKPGPDVADNTEEDPNYWNYVVLACRDLAMFVQIAEAAGPELTNDSFLAGLESLTQASLPEIPFVSWGSGKYNGGDTMRIVVYDGTADEDGELIPQGDPFDISS